MNTKIKKWGNSLALRIPKSMADEINIKEGADVKLKLEKNKIIVLKENLKKFNLKELLSGISKANLHGEVDYGRPAGREEL